MKSKLLALFFIFSIGVSCGQSFKKLQLNHLAINVVNLKRSVQFYQGVLGLDSIPEPFHDGKHVWLDIGADKELHIIQGADKPKEYFQNNHICLSTDNVVAFTKLLESKKITWVDVSGTPHKITTRPDGVLQIWLKDPD